MACWLVRKDTNDVVLSAKLLEGRVEVGVGKESVPIEVHSDDSVTIDLKGFRGDRFNTYLSGGGDDGFYGLPPQWTEITVSPGEGASAFVLYGQRGEEFISVSRSENPPVIGEQLLPVRARR